MKPSDFKYFKANSLEHALDILNSEENVKIISGGQSLVPLMNFRLGQPDILLDINDIKDLKKAMKELYPDGLKNAGKKIKDMKDSFLNK